MSILAQMVGVTPSGRTGFSAGLGVAFPSGSAWALPSTLAPARPAPGSSCERLDSSPRDGSSTAFCPVPGLSDHRRRRAFRLWTILIGRSHDRASGAEQMGVYVPSPRTGGERPRAATRFLTGLGYRSAQMCLTPFKTFTSRYSPMTPCPMLRSSTLLRAPVRSTNCSRSIRTASSTTCATRRPTSTVAGSDRGGRKIVRIFHFAAQARGSVRWQAGVVLCGRRGGPDRDYRRSAVNRCGWASRRDHAGATANADAPGTKSPASIAWRS